MNIKQLSLSLFRNHYSMGVGIVFGFICSTSQAVPQKLTFSATVLQGSCEISLKTPVVEFGEMQATEMLGAQKHSKIKPVEVQLTECKGIIDGPQKPLLSISGVTIGGEPNLFRNGGTSSGFGVVISENAGIDISGGIGLAKDGSEFAFAGKTKGGSVANGDIMTLYTAVSCGVNCKDVKVGTLEASAQLEFLYR
ncbi:fimbrial protein [Serratia liquefaciens]|uniref:fimbrial protein n=1 Tax=Serratia liquefaciens TaxID=614 RepID=UPI002157D8D7|nr:fimbrial protein [Serratia liquefaciens]